MPIVKRFLGENFQSRQKWSPKMALIRGNGGHVRDPEKAHPCAEPRVLAYILRQNPSRGLGCCVLQEPAKKN